MSKEMFEETNKLSELLDAHRDVDLKDSDIGPKDILSCLLSLHFTTNTTKSSLIFKTENDFNRKDIRFRKIGFGQCGLVFERPGWAYVAKVSRPTFGDALWSDFAIHLKVSKAFRKRSIECRVPALYGYVGQHDEAWWADMLPRFPDNTADFPIPSNVLLSERILPLPRVARNALVDMYCPEHLCESAKLSDINRDCLARVYLGRRREDQAQLAPNFTLRNFNLHLDQMVDLELPVDDFAKYMGEALAIMHWEANVDGYDIEFVLGSEPVIDHYAESQLTFSDIVKMQQHTSLSMKTANEANSSQRTTRLWCLDFNLCSTWPEEAGWQNPDGLVEQLVLAFFENDPYYPLPLMEEDLGSKLWSLFRETYLSTSDAILATSDPRLRGLPAAFIDGCVERERRKLGQGKGHGHRDCKA